MQSLNYYKVEEDLGPLAGYVQVAPPRHTTGGIKLKTCSAVKLNQPSRSLLITTALNSLRCPCAYTAAWRVSRYLLHRWSSRSSSIPFGPVNEWFANQLEENGAVVLPDRTNANNAMAAILWKEYRVLYNPTPGLADPAASSHGRSHQPLGGLNPKAHPGEVPGLARAGASPGLTLVSPGGA
eukprot:1190267-Prorocentrum_minimum.AAC.1